MRNWRKMILIPLCLLGLVAAKGSFRDEVRARLSILEDSVVVLFEGVVYLLEKDAQPGQAAAGLYVIDAAGQTLGPAGIQADGTARTVLDVAGVGLVSCDVRGIEGEILKPANSDIQNEIFWTGPACTGTPFSLGRIFTPATLPAVVSIATVPTGTYQLGAATFALTPMSAEGESGCQELELPFVPVPAFEVIRIAPFIGETYPSPYSLELR